MGSSGKEFPIPAAYLTPFGVLAYAAKGKQIAGRNFSVINLFHLTIKYLLFPISISDSFLFYQPDLNSLNSIFCFRPRCAGSINVTACYYELLP
ncbi:unnamed protein product [Phytomonas sp. EM1]|nr:unnamed protein product [Phytomonas sp. EM1]|eukprot:CCW60213.1 unnamed protein product [Phytomonas sp. isolate EM1]